MSQCLNTETKEFYKQFGTFWPSRVLEKDFFPTECVLPENYPLYFGHHYIGVNAKGRLKLLHWKHFEKNVAFAKKEYGIVELRKCDLEQRGIT